MFDIVINNGTIVDPIDGEYQRNIGIKDSKITEISQHTLSGKIEINAESKKVSPGFIDIHMHEDLIRKKKIELEVFNYMALMGVTTVVGGNCGIGNSNVSGYLQAIDKQGSPVNYIGLVPLAEVRKAIGCIDKYKPASNKEILKIIKTLTKELDNGALGVSFGLEYAPGTSTEELLQISSAVSNYPNKMVSCHYRFDANRSLEALAEMIIVARETKVKFQISHIGSCIAFGHMNEGLRMLEEANKVGIKIMADVYPYDAFCSYIGSAVYDSGCFERWGVDYDSIEIAEGKYKGRRCNKKIFEYVREKEPEALSIAFVMDEKEVIEAIKHPLTMIASDGLIHNRQGHPRSTGTFPRVLGKYVRQRKDLDLISAINKMTNMPAQRIGLKSKGRIMTGFDADITIFNYSTIIDNSSFAHPSKPPTGIDNVLVGGVEVVKNGELTGKLPGASIRF